MSDKSYETAADIQAERDALRAELAALKGQEPMAEVRAHPAWRAEYVPLLIPLWGVNPPPQGTKLYAAPAPTAQPVQAARTETGPRGSAANLNGDCNDDESDSGRARRPVPSSSQEIRRWSNCWPTTASATPTHYAAPTPPSTTPPASPGGARASEPATRAALLQPSCRT